MKTLKMRKQSLGNLPTYLPTNDGMTFRPDSEQRKKAFLTQILLYTFFSGDEGIGETQSSIGSGEEITSMRKKLGCVL